MSAESAPRAEEAPRREGRLMSFVTKATAVVALVSAVVGLAYKFWPQPTPVQRAALESPRVEPGLTFEQYLERTGQDPGSLARDVLARRGALIQFEAEATGYRGKELKLEWQVVDLSSQDLVLKKDALTLRPTAETDRFRPPPEFAPYPERGGPFRVDAQLFAPDGVSLSFTQERFGRS